MGTAEMETMDALETYAEYSQSSLLYLLLEAMGIRHEGAEFAASHVGVSKGILTLLRAYEAHRLQVWHELSTNLCSQFRNNSSPYIWTVFVYLYLGSVLLSSRCNAEAWIEAIDGSEWANFPARAKRAARCGE